MAEYRSHGHPNRSERNSGYSNRRTTFSVRSVPRCYKQDSKELVGEELVGELVSERTAAVHSL
jgi:hypothetical protein